MLSISKVYRKRLAEVRLMVETSHTTCRGILENHLMVKIKAPPLLPTFDGLQAEAILRSRVGTLGQQAEEDYFETLKRGKKKRCRVVERY